MSIGKRTLPCVVVLALGASLSALAAQDKAAEKADQKAAAPSAEEIAALVKQLDSDKFAERQAASDKLSQIGKPAIGAVAEAAAGDSLEATVRAIDILKKMLDSSDKPTQEEAKGAMEKIAKSDRPAAARRAEDALKDFQAKQQQQAPRFAPGAIQIAVAAGGARRVSVRNVNGVKTIEADEGNRKVKIVDDPNQGIKMEVTTKKDNGKESTEKYEAKNAEELKKKHPKAHEIYEKYSKQGGNFMIQMQAARAVPVRARPRRVNTIDTAARILPAWTNHLKRLVSDEALKGASKESNETLRTKVAEMKEQLDDIDKRLQKAIEQSEKEKKEADKEEEKAKEAERPGQDAK